MPQYERSLRWNDPALGIAWPGLEQNYQLAGKDRDAPVLAALGAEGALYD
jgi:dTDP-4-dehydrorhamnose 3,5-epimerase